MFANVIRVLVGEENVSSISLEKFSQQFGLQPIIGKTVNISSENELTRRLNTENLKAIVSGDKVSISVKYQNDIPYTPTLKLVFLMNTLPDTSDTTDGFYRKLLIVPFSHKFTDGEKDVNLFEKLKAEMPGILNWALEGLKRLKANEFRFSRCDAADRAMEEYKEEQNTVPRFVADYVRSDAGNTVSRKTVVDAYMGWIERNGMGDPCKGNYQRFWNAFKAAAKDNGIPFSEKKIHGDRFLNDVSIEAVAPQDGGIDFEE